MLQALKISDNKCDFESVKKVARNVAEQMLVHRERFSKEPIAEEKMNFFLRARYELEREPDLKRQILKMHKKNIKKEQKIEGEEKK